MSVYGGKTGSERLWIKTTRLTRSGPRLLGCMFISETSGTVSATSARITWASTTLERQACSRPSWRCCSWQDAVGAASFATVLLADRFFNQSRRNGGRGFHLRTQHAWPAREHCRHESSLHCPPGHLEGAVRIREGDRHRFLMRSALRHSAPRGRGAAHGAVPRGRVTTCDGGGHDDAGMRRAQNHISRLGRRSK